MSLASENSDSDEEGNNRPVERRSVRLKSAPVQDLSDAKCVLCLRQVSRVVTGVTGDVENVEYSAEQLQRDPLTACTSCGTVFHSLCHKPHASGDNVDWQCSYCVRRVHNPFRPDFKPPLDIEELEPTPEPEQKKEPEHWWTPAANETPDWPGNHGHSGKMQLVPFLIFLFV